MMMAKHSPMAMHLHGQGMSGQDAPHGCIMVCDGFIRASVVQAFDVLKNLDL
jgi:hypothetical protein